MLNLRLIFIVWYCRSQEVKGWNCENFANMLNLISKLRKICWNPVNLNINLVQNLNIMLKSGSKDCAKYGQTCRINLFHFYKIFAKIFTKLYLYEIELTPVETVKKSGEKQSEPKSSHRAAPHFFAHFSRIFISEIFSFLPSFLSQDFFVSQNFHFFTKFSISRIFISIKS